MIKLMYITNQPAYAQAAVAAGVNRIFVDLEYIGKELRQGGMDTVKSHHTVQDVMAVRKAIGAPAQLLVRVNPLYEGSAEEIDSVIEAGADIVMLPMWTSAWQIAEFVRLVGGRAQVMPLLETAQAADALDEILRLEGVDEIYIGLNDLHLSKNQPFIFCPLADGTVDGLCEKMRSAGMPYGFGGIAAMNGGLLPGSAVLGEHVRLGSGAVILSRSFCRNDVPLEEFSEVMRAQIAELRQKEQEIAGCMTSEWGERNHQRVILCVEQIIKERESRA